MTPDPALVKDMIGLCSIWGAWPPNHAAADRRSWQAMRNFFEEIFAKERK